MNLLRLLSALLVSPVLLACIVLSACGGDDAAELPGARLRILTSDADGPIQGTVLLDATGDSAGTVYEATPMASDPDVYIAADAPVGTYYVRSSESWGMLWVGTSGPGAPYLRAGDYPATTVRMGKPHTLYVAASDPRTEHGHVTDVWGADWKVAGKSEDPLAFQKAEIEIVPQGGGLVALQFPAAAWKAGHVIRAGGIYESGAASQVVSFVKRDRHEDLPRIAFTNAAPQQPLRVYFVPRKPGEAIADGRRVEVALQDVPLLVRYEAPTHKGLALFDAVAALGHDLRVAVPDFGADAVFEMTPESWRPQGELHLLDLDPKRVSRVPLESGAKRWTELRVLMQGGENLARVPLAYDGDQAYVTVLPGEQEWWLRRADNTWVHEVVTVPEPEAIQAPIKVQGTAEKAARVRGNVDGGATGFLVRLTLLREPDIQLGGAGLTAAVDAYGQYDLSCPAGRYRLQIIRPGGTGGRARVLPLGAGAEVRLDLSAR